MNSLVYMATWRCNLYGSGVSNPFCPYCNLGHNGQALTIGGVPGSRAKPCDPQEIVDFCLRNAEYFGRRLSISGGEPFMAPNLDDVIQRLAGSGWLWAITSNCLLTPAIERLVGKLSDLNTCATFTASYHYRGDFERFRRGVEIIRAARPKFFACTIVLDRDSAAYAGAIAAEAAGLGFDRVQFQIDFNGGADAAVAKALAPQIPIVADGDRRAGWLCDRHGRHFVLAPDGGVFECLTKAYRGIDRIGDARDVIVEQLPPLRTRCGLVCDLPCDHVKHLRPPASAV